MARPESVYWIGGVPCSGKTPISSALEAPGNATVYHLDEHHDRHIKNTSPETHPAWRFPGRDQYLTLPPAELAHALFHTSTMKRTLASGPTHG